MENILFYFYYHKNIIGGAEMLFSRLANWISQHSSYHVYLCDYEDGFTTKAALNHNIHCITNNKIDKINVPSNTLVVCAGFNVYSINKLFNYDDTSHFFLWSVAPRNTTKIFHIFSKPIISENKRKKIGLLIKELYDAKSFFFMDEPNYRFPSKFFRFEIKNVKYMQILIPNEGLLKEYSTQCMNQNEIRFVWLSRLDVSKFTAFATALLEINALKYKERCRLFVIGDGLSTDKYKEFANSNSSIPVKFVGKLWNNDLTEFIHNNMDIGIAIGTSALELSKCGKPTIVIDAYKTVNKPHVVKFNLLSQMRDFTVGENFTDDTVRSFYFADAVDYVINNYDKCAEECYKYVRDNFTIDSVGAKFLNIVSQITDEDVRRSHIALNAIGDEYSNSFIYYYRKIRHLAYKVIPINVRPRL